MENKGRKKLSLGVDAVDSRFAFAVNRTVSYCDHATDLRELLRGVIVRKMAIIYDFSLLHFLL